jgi:predicted DsbA family dithiol-disulfide isomerase
LKTEHGVDVKFTHFPLHPETPAEGKKREPNPARDERMQTLMEQEGLPYTSGREMTYNSRLAQELAKWAESKGKGYEIHDPLFRAFFVDMKNIGDAAVLAEIAGAVGLPQDEALDTLQRRSFKDAVDADWRRCADLGVTAVPTFVAGRYGVVGAQPYDILEKLVAKVS